VSHLLNVDETLAKKVADGIGLPEMPAAAEPARPVVKALQPSPALSIIGNAPNTVKGRKIGVLVTDGADADLLKGVMEAAKAEGAMLEFVAPKIAGFTCSAGKKHEAQQKVNGGPSVLYDAVVVIPSAEGAAMLTREATAKDFVSDAYAHAKFIGYAETAKPLFDKAGVTDMDEGFVALKGAADARRFIEACRALRFWQRETKVHAV
jgi:catalase